MIPWISRLWIHIYRYVFENEKKKKENQCFSYSPTAQPCTDGRVMMLSGFDAGRDFVSAINNNIYKTSQWKMKKRVCELLASIEFRWIC